MPAGNWENPQVYGQWMIEDSQNWLFANRLRRRCVYQHGFPGFVNFKNTGFPATLTVFHISGLVLASTSESSISIAIAS